MGTLNPTHWLTHSIIKTISFLSYPANGKHDEGKNNLHGRGNNESYSNPMSAAEADTRWKWMSTEPDT